jgi:outer membrane protein assembly factor BamD
MNSFSKLSVLLSIALISMGCKNKPENAEQTEARYRKQANEALEAERYTEALSHLQKIEVSFPLSEQAEQTQLDLIYTYFKTDDKASVITACNQFISNYPDFPRLDYVYYIKGLAQESIGHGFFARLSPVDTHEFDLTAYTSAFATFKTLISQYPKSPYAEDASKRMWYMKSQLAEKELDIARYYYERKAYVAAINRAINLAEKFPDMEHQAVAALYIAEAGYNQLQIPEQAQATANYRKTHYPLSRDKQFKPKNWFKRLFRPKDSSLVSVHGMTST